MLNGAKRLSSKAVKGVKKQNRTALTRYIVPLHGEAARFEFFTGLLLNRSMGREYMAKVEFLRAAGAK